MRTISVAALSLFFFAPLFAEGADLNRLLETARENNPDIKKSREAALAAEAGIKVENSLPDPVFAYKDFLSPVETKNGPQERAVSLSQKFPFPGKLSLKAKAQRAEFMVKMSEFEIVQRRIAASVKSSYYDLYFVEKSIETAREEKKILDAMAESAAAKYEAGLKPLSDILKIKIAADRVSEKTNNLIRKRDSLLSSISELTAAPEIPDIVFPENLEISEKNYGGPDGFLSGIEESPFVKIHEFARKKKKYRRDLARKGYLPDFNAGFSKISIGDSSSGGGEDAETFFVGINLPVWFGKTAGRIKSAESDLKSAEKAYESNRNLIVKKTKDLLYKLKADRKNALLYENALIPRARGVLSAVSADYETGRVPVADWLDGVKMFIESRLSYHKYVASYWKNGALLEKIAGKREER